MADTLYCDCAATPPTMPTCRGHHLPTCAAFRLGRESAEVSRMLKEGDVDGLTDYLTTGVRERAEQAAARAAQAEVA